MNLKDFQLINVKYTSIKESEHSHLLKEFLPKFSTQFQGKISAFRRWQDAQLSLLGRIMLVRGFEEMNEYFDEQRIKYTKYNKPYLENQRLKFNVSHSGDIVICAITHACEIGIDIENIHKVQIKNFKSQMTENEWTNICLSKNPETAFFCYWTQKEAVVKAHGMGLQVPLNSFEIVDDRTMIKGENFLVKEIKLTNAYKCHLAFKDLKHKVIPQIQKIDPFLFS